MDDYIRRGEAIEQFEDSTSAIPEKLARIRIESVPAADVVEVVRCADCKYDERCMFQDFVRDERVEPYDKTEFFCADGKRKDGGQDDGT